jgi:GTP pyrophosphokinase
VIEDTEVTRAEIDQKFGKEIGALVEGLTKIKRLDLVTKKAEQAENFRKLLVAISSDIRVLLIKLADRLHNMRTLEHMKPESRRRVSEETLEIYAPLAGRMGMQTLREELEQLAFKWGSPEAYKTVVDKLDDIHKKNAGLVEEIVTALKARLAGAGLQAEVYGRERRSPSRSGARCRTGRFRSSSSPTSTASASSVDDSMLLSCLGIVHSAWRAVARPLQGLHFRRPSRTTTNRSTPPSSVLATSGSSCKSHRPPCIRSPNTAWPRTPLQGTASSSANTAPTAAPRRRRKTPYIWLRRLVDTLLRGRQSGRIPGAHQARAVPGPGFCFTPKGRLIALPRGATPIDFAYAVHTDVGNSCVGAVINGRQLPLTTQLKNGDQVEILTAKGQTPPAAWERIAVTGKARSSIRRAARDALRRQYSELGRRLLVSAFLRIGQEYTDEKLKKGLVRLTQKSVEEVHAGVGRGELPVKDVIRAIVPEAELDKEPAAAPRKRSRRQRGQSEEGWFNVAKVMDLKFRWPGSGGAEAKQAQVLPIRGLKNDVPVSSRRAAPCPAIASSACSPTARASASFRSIRPSSRSSSTRSWIDVTWDIDPDHPSGFRPRSSSPRSTNPARWRRSRR